MFKDYREQSRVNWGKDQEGGLSIEQINCGAILRIADATEKMAQRHTDLIRERDYYEKECIRLREQMERLTRSNSALRGHIKRMKKGAVK